jgi:hypothetical protein
MQRVRECLFSIANGGFTLMTDAELKSSIQHHAPSNNQRTNSWSANTRQVWALAHID